LPDDRHPRDKKRYADLWAAFVLGTQRLWPVDFVWRGTVISQAD